MTQPIDPARMLRDCTAVEHDTWRAPIAAFRLPGYVRALLAERDNLIELQAERDQLRQELAALREAVLCGTQPSMEDRVMACNHLWQRIADSGVVRSNGYSVCSKCGLLRAPVESPADA